MSPRVRALLIFAALSVFGATAGAKEIPGTPEALIGSFGTSIKQCEERKDEFAFDTLYYRTCPNPGCLKRILSHRVTPSGYRLKIQDDGNFKTWSENVTVIDKNTIKWTVTKATTLHRCSFLETERRSVDLTLFSPDFLFGVYVSMYRRPPEKFLSRLYPKITAPAPPPQIGITDMPPAPPRPLFFWLETLSGYTEAKFVDWRGLVGAGFSR